jgi:hypothetical protein
MAPNPKHRIVTWDTGNPVGPVGAIDPGSVEHHSRHHRKKAGFKSLADTWADTTTSHGKLMLTVLGGLAEFEQKESELIPTDGAIHARDVPRYAYELSEGEVSQRSAAHGNPRRVARRRATPERVQGFH